MLSRHKKLYSNKRVFSSEIQLDAKIRAYLNKRNNMLTGNKISVLKVRDKSLEENNQF